LDKEASNESLEESIFRTLSHQTRRDILRVIGEQKQATFTEIKSKVKVEDSASLSYHLNTLQPLITQKAGKYHLSELGQDVYDLICKTTTYTQSRGAVNFLRSKLPWVIIANAILWATALLLTRQFEGRLTIATTSSFALLWFINSIVLYAILVEVRNKETCLIS
jgi:DNA-binding transcriptional ArsR family regulator